MTVLCAAAERHFATPLCNDRMEAVENIKMAAIDENDEQEGVNQRSLESMKKKEGCSDQNSMLLSLESLNCIFSPEFSCYIISLTEARVLAI